MSIFALASGAIATFTGLRMVENYIPSSTPFAVTGPRTILADSHFRYFGAMWAAWGGLMWWAAEDVRARVTPLRMLWGFMVLGGLGRAHSAWKYGFSTVWAVVATGVEFVVPAAVLVSLR
jgi:hypothetical protein